MHIYTHIFKEKKREVCSTLEQWDSWLRQDSTQINLQSMKDSLIYWLFAPRNNITQELLWI